MFQSGGKKPTTVNQLSSHSKPSSFQYANKQLYFFKIRSENWYNW